MKTITADQILSATSFQVMISMSDLLAYGSWDFRADYESQEVYDYSKDTYTTPDPEKYDKWVDNCNVRIIFRNGESIYEIKEWNGNGYSDWGSLPTGDDAASASDIAQAIADGKAEILEVDYE